MCSSTAPYVFTKLLHPLVCLWLGKGCKAILYLDDGICTVVGEGEACRVSRWVRDTLEKQVLWLMRLNVHGHQPISFSG